MTHDDTAGVLRRLRSVVPRLTDRHAVQGWLGLHRRRMYGGHVSRLHLRRPNEERKRNGRRLRRRMRTVCAEREMSDRRRLFVGALHHRSLQPTVCQLDHEHRMPDVLAGFCVLHAQSILRMQGSAGAALHLKRSSSRLAL